MAENTLYRIYTEDNEGYRANVSDLVADVFPSFSIIPARGTWQGAAENSIIIEVMTGADTAWDAIRGIAAKIRDYNKQETVLVTRTPVSFELI